jgi:hypothetical protein
MSEKIAQYQNQANCFAIIRLILSFYSQCLSAQCRYNKAKYQTAQNSLFNHAFPSVMLFISIDLEVPENIVLFLLFYAITKVPIAIANFHSFLASQRLRKL